MTLFDHVIESAKIGLRKPHPRIYQTMTDGNSRSRSAERERIFRLVENRALLEQRDALDFVVLEHRFARETFGSQCGVDDEKSFSTVLTSIRRAGKQIVTTMKARVAPTISAGKYASAVCKDRPAWPPENIAANAYPPDWHWKLMALPR
jgi:hypothetical protein